MIGSGKQKWLGSLGLIFMMLFFYLPIITLIFFSFNSSKSLSHFTGFSTQWYVALLRDNNALAAIRTTIVIAFISTIISTIVGTLTAIGLSKSSPVLKRVVSSINQLPILNPDIVTAVSLMILFSSIPMIQKGFGTMLLAHIAFSIPYVILTIMPKLRQLDANLTDAAMDLGATPLQALLRVILPQIAPAIISASLIAFTMSFDDFVISYFVTGNGVSNISILVYTMSKRTNPTINALSTLIVGGITVLLVIVNIVPLIKGNKENKKEKRMIQS